MKMKFLASAAALACGSLFGVAGAAVQVAAPDYVVREQDGQIQINVSLTARDSASSPVTVNYRTLDGTADSSQDYVTTAGTLVWELGDFSDKVVTIPITNDATLENDESFTVQLFSASGTSISSQSVTSIRIVDDDSRNSGQLQFVATQIGVREANVTFSVSVQRINGSAGAVSVDYSSTGEGTATPLSDWSSTAGTLRWGDGDITDKSFTVQIFNDSVAEPDETIVFGLSNPTGGALLGGRPKTTVSIVDDDRPGSGVIAMGSSSVRVNEDDGVAQVFAVRSGGSAGAVQVDFTANEGSATRSDFRLTSGTVTWADGEVGPKSIPVVLTDDGVVESDESFDVVLSNAAGGNVTLGTPAATSVTIADNDTERSTISFVSSDYMVVDNQAFVQVEIARTGPAVSLEVADTVVVSTQDISALAGQDYTAVSTSVSWASKESGVRVVNIPVTRFGSQREPNEFFQVNLGSSSSGKVVSPSSALVLIQSYYDAVGESSIQLNSTSYSVGDRDSCVPIQVSRTGATASDVNASVRLRTSDQSAVADSDYTAVDQVLTWSGTDMSPKSVCVPIKPPSAVEDTETFGVSLSEVAGNGVIGTNSSAVVTIRPSAASTISFERPDYSASDTEGAVTIAVRRTGDLSGALSVRVTSRDGSATAEDDYGAVDQLVSWGSGDGRPQTITIGLVGPSDTEVEQTEVFSLGVVVESGLGTIVAPSSATVAIVPGGVSGVQFVGSDPDGDGIIDITVSDRDGFASLTVARIGNSIGQGAVDVITSPGTATEGEDYIGSSQSVSWAAGAMGTVSISIPIVGPGATAEQTENFTVLLANATGRLGIARPNAVRVTIKSSTAEESKGVGGGSFGLPLSFFFIVMLTAKGVFRRFPVLLKRLG